MRSCFTSIGGIAVKTGASAVLVESAVMDCESTEYIGGGVFAYDGANVTLQGARIERCHAIYGGGMRPSLSHVALSVAWVSPRPSCVASREETRGPTCDRESQCAL